MPLDIGYAITLAAIVAAMTAWATLKPKYAALRLVHGSRIASAAIVVATAAFFGVGFKLTVLKITGLLLAPLMTIAIALPIKQTILSWTCGVYYDEMLGVHKTLGILTAMMTALHTVAYIANWSTPQLQNHPFALIDLFAPTPRAFGTAATICVLVMTAASMNCVRTRRYNIFIAVHYLYWPLLALTALHRPLFIGYAIAAYTLLALDYGCRTLYFSERHTATLQVYKGGYVRLRFPATQLIRSRMDVGKHVFVYIPQISCMETHPFSLTNHRDSSHVELGIQPLGDYTKKLIEHGAATVQLRISGVFGRFGIDYASYPELILICGGVGVTPFIGLLKQIYYGQPTAIHFVSFLWYCRDELLYEAHKELFDACIHFNTLPGEQLPHFMPIIAIRSREINTGIFQYVDVAEFFADIMAVGQDESYVRRIGVICCSGESLSRDVAEVCAAHPRQISFHNHSFTF